MARSKNPIDLVHLGRWIHRIVAEGAIFVGGTAVGAGIMLLRRGESFKGRPGVVFAIGLGIVALALMGRCLKAQRSRTLKDAARS